MTEVPKRRLLDQISGSPMLVSEGSNIMGDVVTPGTLIVFGSIRGDGMVGGALNMAAKASWEGRIQARRAVIAGTIIGRISVEEKLEIGATAVIRGQVSARSIAIARGAVIDGEVTVTSGEAVVNFEERRSHG